jgi:hypothetical protein
MQQGREEGSSPLNPSTRLCDHHGIPGPYPGPSSPTRHSMGYWASSQQIPFLLKLASVRLCYHEEPQVGPSLKFYCHVSGKLTMAYHWNLVEEGFWNLLPSLGFPFPFMKDIENMHWRPESHTEEGAMLSFFSLVHLSPPCLLYFSHIVSSKRKLYTLTCSLHSYAK